MTSDQWDRLYEVTYVLAVWSLSILGGVLAGYVVLMLGLAL